MFRLVIKNCQSLEDVDIAFDRGSFVAITGKSDIGKSAIIRALKTVFYNDSDLSYIRNGQSEMYISFGVTHPSIEDLKGNIVQIDVTKSKTKNEFRVTSRLPDGSFQTKSYPKVGKTTPEEIQEILGFSELVSERENSHNLHFQTQLKSLFLVTETETEASSVLNKIFDLDRYEAVLRLVNSDKLAEVREHAKVTDTFTKLSIRHEEALQDYTKEKSEFDTLIAAQEEFKASVARLEELTKAHKSAVYIHSLQATLEDAKQTHAALLLIKESLTLSQSSLSTSIKTLVLAVKTQKRLKQAKEELGAAHSITEAYSHISNTLTSLKSSCTKSFILNKIFLQQAAWNSAIFENSLLNDYLGLSGKLVKSMTVLNELKTKAMKLKQSQQEKNLLVAIDSALTSYSSGLNSLKISIEIKLGIAQYRKKVNASEASLSFTKHTYSLMDQAKTYLETLKKEVFVIAGKCPLCETVFCQDVKHG